MKQYGRVAIKGVILIVLCACIVLVSVALLGSENMIAQGNSSTYIKNGTIREAASAVIGNITQSITEEELVADGSGVIQESENEYTITSPEGMVSLAKFTNGNDTDGKTFVIAINEGTNSVLDETFPGIGSLNHPFRGTLQSRFTTRFELSASGALFRYLSTEATLFTDEGTMTLQANRSAGLLAQVLVVDTDTPFVVSDRITLVQTEQGGIENTFISSNKLAETGAVAGKVVAGKKNSLTIDLSQNGGIDVSSVKALNKGNAGLLIGYVAPELDVTLNIGTQVNFSSVSVTAGIGYAGGIIGFVSGGSTVSLQLADDATAINMQNLAVEASCGNAGGIVGNIEANGTLYVQFDVAMTGSTLIESYKGNGVGGNAGGVSGVLADGVTVNLKGFSIEGDISGGNSAGGFAGVMSDAVIGVQADKNITINNLTVSGNKYAGGYLGEYSGSSRNFEINIPNTGNVLIGNITAVPLGNAAVAFGGVIGNMNISGGDVNIHIGNGITTNVEFTFATATGVSQLSTGGVVGTYSNTDISKTFRIYGDNIAQEIKSRYAERAVRYGGGIIGLVSANCYVELESLCTYCDFTNAPTYRGNVIGYLTAGSIVRMGDIACHGTSSGTLSAVAYTGESSVLALFGTFDFSSLTYVNTVTQQNKSLIYAESGCNIIRSSTAGKVKGDDIGNYGQIINNGALGLISIDENHAVLVEQAEVTLNGGRFDIDIANEKDFAAVAITIATSGGINGVTNGTPDDLISSLATYNIGSDLDLSDKGIESLIPVNEVNKYFDGIIMGNNHKITVNIGAHYKDDTTYTNDYGIFSHVYKTGNTNGEEAYIALIPRAKTAKLKAVSVDGKIKINDTCEVNTRYYSGGFFARTDGDVTFENCDSAVIIDCSDDAKSDKQRFSLGGFAGTVALEPDSGKTVTVKNCKTSTQITLDRYKANNSFAGGFIGQALEHSQGNNLEFLNCESSAVINISHPNGVNAGALVAAVGKEAVTEYGRISVKLNGISLKGAGININGTADSSGYGGLLGTNWYAVDVDIKNLTLDSDCYVRAQSISQNFGALLYTVVGKVTLDGSSTELLGTYTGNKNSGSDSFMIYDGTKMYFVLHNADDFAAMMKQNISSGDLVLNSGSTYKDYIVAKNITRFGDSAKRAPERGGVVTLENGGAPGSFAGTGSTGYMWYEKIGSNNYNIDTRYFCNVEAGISRVCDDGNPIPSNINNESDLITWSVFNYANQYESSDGLTEFYQRNIPTSLSLNNDLDLSGLCFYPTSPERTLSFDMGNHSITFDTPNDPILSAVTNNTHQMRMAQVGLLLNVDKNTSVSNGTVEGNVITFGGYSGFLVSGTLGKAYENSQHTDITFNVSNVTMNGISVNNASAATPLMINKVSECVTGTFDKIKTTGYISGTKAGSSLIGSVGGDSAHHLYFTFSGMELDEYDSVNDTQKTPFITATMISSLNYIVGSGNFTYNFNRDEDWNGGNLIHKVTYGRELTEKQTTYYDYSNYYVSPLTNSASAVYDFSGYLPYVISSNTDTILNVNVIIGNLLSGYGTYEHPYRITQESQFMAIWSMINSETANPGWKVNYPTNTSRPTAYNEYVFNDGVLTSGTKSITAAQLRKWMQYAYYIVDRSENGGTEYDLSGVSSLGVGLGNTECPFGGVIIGGDTGITLKMPKIVGENVGKLGLISVANGCVLKDINISYPLGEDDIYNLDPSATLAFGGAIDTVIGGDNLIDNVNVVDLDGHLSVNSDYIFVGGYVGIIKTGGVIFRNITSNGIRNTAAGDTSVYKDSFYVNPYIGRVLDGYSCVDSGDQLDNTDKNYTIIKLPSGFDPVTISDKTYTIPDNYALWTFASAVNSGSLSYAISGSGYSNNVRSRYGVYDGVGTTVHTDTVTDGLMANDKTGTNPYLLSRFESSVSKTALNTSNVIKIVLNNDSYDMTSFKNGYRGIGPRYNTSAMNYLRVNEVTGAVGYSALKLAMNVKQCGRVELRTSEANTETSNTTFTTEASGYFTGSIGGLINNLPKNDALTVSNINITGELTFDFDNKMLTVDGATSGTMGNTATKSTFNVGGIIGYVTGTVSFRDINVRNYNSVSPESAGGIVGITKAASTFTDCAYNGIKITAASKLGGFCGSGFNGITVNANRVTSLMNAELFLRIGPSNIDLSNFAYLSMYEGAGGIVGNVENNEIHIGSDNYTIGVSNVAVYMAQHGQKTKGGRCGIGGIMGSSYLPNNKNCTFKNIAMSDVIVIGETCFSGAVDTSLSSQIISDYDLEHYISDSNVRTKTADMISGAMLKSGGAEYSCICAGGVIGYFAGSGGNSGINKMVGITVENVKFNSQNYGIAVVGSNAVGGIIGDNRCYSSTATLRNCNFNTVDNDKKALIFGETRTGGIVGYSVGKSGSTYSNNVIENCNVGKPSQTTYMITNGITSQSMSGGIICDAYNLTINGAKTERVANIAHLSGGISCRLGDEAGVGCTVSISNATVNNGWIYSISGSNGNNYSAAGGIVGQMKGSASNPVKLYLNECEVRGTLIEAANNASYATHYCGGIIGVIRNKGEVYGQFINLAESKVVAGRLNYGTASSNLTIKKILNADIAPVEDSAVNNGIENDTLSVITNKCGVVVGFSDASVEDTVQILGMHRSDVTDSALISNIATRNKCKISVVYTDFGYTGKEEGDALIDLKNKPTTVIGTSGNEVTLIGDGAQDADYQNTMKEYEWWNNDVDYSGYYTTYKDLMTEGTTDIEFPIFDLSGTLNSDINSVLCGYLNYLTNRGFDDWNTVSSQPTVRSARYTVGEDGSVTRTGNGSIAYNDNKFVFSGQYDEIKDGTFTVVTVTFTGKNKDGNVEYSMDIPIYFKQILGYKSNLIVLGEENYVLNDYLTSSSKHISVDNDGIISVYMEYIYNEIRADFDTHLKKALSCSIALKEGTKLTLIDLNSNDSSDFRAYYYTITADDVANALGKNTFYINFESFEGLTQTALKDLPNDLTALNGYTLEEYEGIERYLMVVELTGENLTVSNQELVDMYATTEEVSNIAVIADENKATVTLWKGIDIDLGESVEKNLISSSEEKKVEATVRPSITYPSGYITAMGGTTEFYGVLSFKLQNATGSKNVPLPEKTNVTVLHNGEVVQNYQTTSAEYSVNHIITDNGVPMNILRDGIDFGTYQVVLDFSEVETTDFASTFESSANYLLESTLYVTTNTDMYSNARNKKATVLLVSDVISRIKISLNKRCDSLYFGVNRKDLSDRTNSGKIDFEIHAVVTGFEPGDPASGIQRQAMLRFRLKEKDASGRYVEVAPSKVFSRISSLTSNSDPSTLYITSDGEFIEVPITVDENSFYDETFTLKLNSNIKYFANYMIEGEIFIRERSNGSVNDTDPATDHLIYTVAKINNILDTE